MSHLTGAQIAELRAELQRQLAKLEKSMTITDEALKTVELDQGAVGRLSRMDSLQNQSLAKGFCATCGTPVAAERLLVFPESGTCARCGV